MSIKLKDKVPLAKIDEFTAWTEIFDAQARAKEIKDEARLTDEFLSNAGLQEVLKIKQIVAPKTISSMKWDDIKAAIKNFLEPKKKLLIAERTIFMQMKQESETIGEFAARLREQAVKCEFESFKDPTANPSEELTKMRLIAGIRDPHVCNKILEKELAIKMTTDQIIDFAMQLNHVKDFVSMSGAYETTPQSPALNQNINATTKVEDDVHMSNATSTGHKYKKCYRCGSQWHDRLRDCKALQANCKKCGVRGHFAIVCRNTRKSANFLDDTPEDHIFHLHSTKADHCFVKVNDKWIEMEKDTGASSSLISEKMWNDLGRPALKKPRSKMITYDGHEMRQMGNFECVVESELHKFSVISLSVIKCDRKFGLAGRDLLSQNIFKVSEESRNKYAELTGIKGALATITLKPDATPIELPARELPLPMKIRVKQELGKMEAAGIIEKVESSEWASPIVVAVKPGRQNVRICGDYSAVNKLIQNQTYLSPSIETAFAKMSSKKIFCKLDLSDAYYQIRLEEKSKDITTINTPFGRYRFNRLPYGIKISPAVFQREMETLVGEHPNIIIFQDDILIGAEEQEELSRLRHEVLRKLNEAEVVFNESKSIMETREVSFLGHILNEDGIRPDDTLIDKIKTIALPTNRKELEKFLGLTQFYGRLIPNFAEMCKPLSDLRSPSVKFEISGKAAMAFEEIKTALSSKPCIKPYDLHSHVILRVDASEHSLGGVLIQNEHPVMFMSRKLTTAESHYSNIEREALAIIWAVERSKKLLLGRKFTIHTDHQPLKFIFQPIKGLSKSISARLARWALRLSAYDFDIEYVAGRHMKDADALSRLEFSTPSEQNCHTETIFESDFQPELVTLEEVRHLTDLCSLSKRLKKRISTGKWGQVSQSERPFKSVATSLSVEDGLIIRGSCIVAPPLLRQRIIQLAHDPIHCSTENSLALISKEFWWPGMTKDVSEYVSKCNVCLQHRPCFKKTIDVWPKENQPWSRVHMDHCVVDGAGLILILSDAYSGWPEAIVVPDRTTETTMKVLRAVFARNGIPVTLVSDNAPEFKAEKFTSWLRQIGCKPMNSPPYSPPSNGQAERLVRTLKDALKAWNHAIPFQHFLQKVLLTLRTAKPSGGRPNSPDIMMWNRRLRHPLTMRERVGEAIWLRNHTDSEPKKATFISQQGQNTALVLVENQGMRLAHRNQWTDRGEPDSEDVEVDCKQCLQPETLASEGEASDCRMESHPTTRGEAPVACQSDGQEKRYNLRSVPRVNYKV